MSWKRQDPGFGKDLVMTGKGGARHEPKPWVDVGLLYKCLEKHECLVADMGSYEHISSQGAPNAKALLGLKDLWVGLLELAPSGSIHSQPLRQALVSLGQFENRTVQLHVETCQAAGKKQGCFGASCLPVDQT